MRNFGRRRGRREEASLSGSNARRVHATEAVTVPTHFGQVARLDSRDRWLIAPPSPLRFAGALSRDEVIAEIRGVLGDVEMNLADMEFAILEHDSWIELQLWVKRFLADIGYRYLRNRRDCDKFARAIRFAADLLGEVNLLACPLLGGIYAHMDEPFAGIADGYHALNLSRTDRGGFVSEPQGINLTYQRLEPWAETRRINEVFSD